MRVSLNNFRGFATTPDIEIRPLTILIGENSTGKTSLLAALRFALGLSSLEETSFFNSQPFDFGPYEDVVYSLGPEGKRKRFSISVEKYVNLADDRRFSSGESSRDGDILVKATFFFKSNFGETVISSVRLASEGEEINFHLDKDTKMTVFSGSENLEFDQTDLFQASMFRGGVSLEMTLFFLMQSQFIREGGSVRTRDTSIRKFAELYDAFLTKNYEVITSPPVRSVPKKVYTTSDETTFAQSGNAPHDLSKIKRSDRKRWVTINKNLNAFGKKSGLFNKFDIKKLTHQDSGPFQVKVTVRNHVSAISDVGYGVSQSLPIMTDLIINRNSRAALLLQQPEVHLHPKAQAELGSMFVNFVTNNTKGIIVAKTHSDHLVDRVRIEILEGRLNPHLLNIVFLCPSDNGVDVHQISVDSLGNILNAPESYREFFIREQERVMGI